MEFFIESRFSSLILILCIQISCFIGNFRFFHIRPVLRQHVSNAQCNLLSLRFCPAQSGKHLTRKEAYTLIICSFTPYNWENI